MRRVVVAAVTLAVLVAPVGLAPAWAEGDGPPGEWWYRAMAVDELHEQATGEGVTIAVLDGPVDPTVPDLRGQDVTPVRSFCGSDSSATATGPLADHATSVTSLLVGSGHGNGPGGLGIRGIAPDATVRTYTVYEGENSEGNLVCSTNAEVFEQRMAHAMNAAILDGADIISVSLAVHSSQTLEQALDYAQESGVVIVGSAGNSRAFSYPGSHPGAVAVGGVNKNGQVAEASMGGPFSVVAAPSEDVMAGAYDDAGWHSDARGSGTSLAAPIVAGTLALVKEKYPEATGWQLVRHAIYNTTDDALTWDETYGFGVVSGREMLAEDPTRWRDSNPFAEWLPKRFIGSKQDELTGPAASEAPAKAAGEDADGEADSSDVASAQGGFPAGAWVAGSVAALVVGGAAVTVLRGRVRTRTVRDEPHGGSEG